jgi:uncharacterized protein YfaS (alpha-2-macroglobulin family)
MVGEP